jgi:hypothetical protein
MKKLLLLGIGVLICSTGVAGYLLHQEKVRRDIERDKALHRAAIADSEEIDRGIKAYYEQINKPLELRNDILQLKNDELEHDIARR